MNLDIFLLKKDYTFFKNTTLSLRLFTNTQLVTEINKLDKNLYNINIIGHSINKKKIYKISWGIGKTKVLIWSQMHGNESTGTLSILDILNFFQKGGNLVEFLYKNLTIYFIPMLNPDGAEIFSRRNFIGLDLNRDALSLQSPEIKLLFQEVKMIHPNILFNLHDQKSIYNVYNTNEPAVLSFLAPCENEKKTITKNRIIIMQIINFIIKEISKLIPGKIARYFDDFYPTATGDRFQQIGYPCLLFEAGYFNNDILKIKTRKYNTLSIISALYTISKKNYIDIDYNKYFTIPINGIYLFDKIYRKVIINNNNIEYLIDIGLCIEEIYNYNNKKIIFQYKIVEIGDLTYFFGRKDINLNGKYYFLDKKNCFPKIGQFETFKFIKKYK